MTAAVLGVSVLGERVTGAGALGAALVLGALAVLALRPVRRRGRRWRSRPDVARPSTAELLAADLRREILDGHPAAGGRVRERELVERYGVARHTLRAALRQLAAEGLVRIEPHRGAGVARLGPEDVRWLYELRAALEHRGRASRARAPRRPPSRARARGAGGARGPVPDPYRRGARSATPTPACGAIVVASKSPRIVAAHGALTGELLLFLMQLRPRVEPDRLVADHRALVAGPERDGAGVLRAHLREAAETLGASAGRS